MDSDPDFSHSSEQTDPDVHHDPRFPHCRVFGCLTTIQHKSLTGLCKRHLWAVVPWCFVAICLLALLARGLL